MRVPASPPTVFLPDDAPEWARLLVQTIQEHQVLQSTAINGALGFGDGLDIENIRGEWVEYTTNGVADTEDTIPHSLGETPKGWIEFSRDKAGVLYKGTTAWTSSNIYLKNSGTSVTVLIFVYAGS